MTDEELVKLIERIEAKQAEARKWRTKNGCEDIGFGTEDELLDALKYSLDRIEQLVETNEVLVKDSAEMEAEAHAHIELWGKALREKAAVEAKVKALMKERDAAYALLSKIELSLSKISGFFFDTFPRKEIRAILKGN